MKQIIQLIASLFIANLMNAQTPNLDWAKGIVCTNANKANSIISDLNGNVYTVGYFAGISDFDPSQGTYTLSSNGINDAFILKQDQTGNLVWAKNIGGSSIDFAYSINLDNANNVYVTGAFQGTVDFDPNPSTYNLTSFGDYDIFVLKLDASGNFLWARQMGGSSTDYGYSIKVNSSGVYISGFFNGVSEFNQLPATQTLSSVGGTDAFVAKLNINGNFLWAKQIGGTASEIAYSITVDAFGDVILCGNFEGTADFDPSANVSSLTSSGSSDIFISKLDASGSFVWAKNLGGSLADIGMAITTNTLGEIYTTGYFQALADFDPSSSNYTLSSFGGSTDIFISKLDVSGNFIWAKAIGGSSNDLCNAIALDVSGYVYMTGSFNGTIDFDPNSTVNNLTSVGSKDIFILKIDDNGNFVWAQNYGDITSDNGYAISVDVANVIYTTGTFTNKVDFDLSAGIDTLSAVSGMGNIYVLKLNESTLGLKDNWNSNNINIYPNPFNNKLNVMFLRQVDGFYLTVLNSLGQIIKIINKPDQEQTVDFSGLPNGVYYLKIKNSSEQQTIKIIKI
ncbi:MAG: T9SS type A sorting domain-containing protein [Bacteroidia bacterium]|nr:T9SS type A sorting domain-containing protein [Bacteroidia bacterium]